MAVEDLLSRLDGVRQRGPRAWIAKCPAHQDKSPSLVISEIDDGRTLLYCHAQCGAKAVLGAVGLDWDVLFPLKDPRIGFDEQKRVARPYNPHDILAALSDEAAIVFHAANQIVRGPKALTPADKERVLVAAERINAAMRLAHGKR